jgi:S1-C subfamily serine protease
MPHISLTALAKEKRSSIVRIVCQPQKAALMTGTGFFIDSYHILTCAHVVLGHANLLALLAAHSRKVEDVDNEGWFEKYFNKHGISITVEYETGEKVKPKKVQFNGAMDVAILHVGEEGAPLPIDENAAKIGDDIMTMGFPYTIQTDDVDLPYSASKGNVMSFPTVQVGGTLKRTFVQTYCPSMGGASGSPIFSSKGRVIGILNGQMRWGDDNFVFMDGNKSTMTKDAFHVPLPYGFVTPIEDVLKVVKKLLS